MSNRPSPGWRYFECEECKYLWKESCRDCRSPSSSICPVCSETVHPFNGVVDTENVLVDEFCNLLEEEKVVKLEDANSLR